MSQLIVLGLQWGDEGKGKIVDLLCPAFDAVVRYQGGHNAGHTVRFGDRHFALHLIPSGILHERTRCVLGNGMVISPEAFFDELEHLEGSGVDVDGRLFISERAHVLLPLYAAVDQARERRLGDRAIGTTSRGIGPAYESRTSRAGIRMCDLPSADLEARLRPLYDRLMTELGAAGETVPELEAVAAECGEWSRRLEPYVTNTEALLQAWMEQGHGLLFEGAQGALLDLDHGTYPFVTSSSSTAGGACTGSGVPPTRIDGVMGVLKAYTSRVGSGPFATELFDETGEFLRERGNEFGTTTGRPRRCGWLDLVASRYACRLNGVASIALTKLDVLDDLEEIPVCVGYRLDGEVVYEMPAKAEDLERVEPVYEVLPGWQEETVGALEFDALPERARRYVQYVEERLDAAVHLISTGPRREETCLRRDGWLDRVLGDRIDRVAAAVRG
jgi:adenylosuccinate synthase